LFRERKSSKEIQEGLDKWVITIPNIFIQLWAMCHKQDLKKVLTGAKKFSELALEKWGALQDLKILSSFWGPLVSRAIDEKKPE
jgi:hypothetical protein